MSVIEFQKRGLPHCHDAVHRPTSAADTDAVIQAELPNVGCSLSEASCTCDAHSLRKLVDSHMIHTCSKGSCIEENWKGICDKGFPAPLAQDTTIDEKGFAHEHERLDRPTYGTRRRSTENQRASKDSAFVSICAYICRCVCSRAPHCRFPDTHSSA
jgi:hypothetical protein